MEFYYDHDDELLYVGEIIGFQGFALKRDQLIAEMDRIDAEVEAFPFHKHPAFGWGHWEAWALDFIARGAADFSLFYGHVIKMPHVDALALAEEHSEYEELENTPW